MTDAPDAQEIAPVETSLRDDITAAITEVEAREAAPAEDAPEAAEPQPDSRARDATGKFAKVEATTEPSPEPLPEPVAAAPAASTPPADAMPPPQAWRADEKAAWEKMAPEARAAVLRREQDVAQLVGRVDNERQWGRAMAPVVAPYLDAIRASNAAPEAVVKGLLETQWKLHTGTPDEKVGMIHQICRDFGIDIQHAASNVPPPIDPAIATLQREIAELRGRVAQPAPAADPGADFQREIDAFAADPKNVHFEALKPQIGALLSSGVGSLQEAYDQAMWASPDLRSTLLDAQQRASEAKQAERVAEARRAAVSLPGASGSPKPTGTSETSLRDDLRSAFRQAVGVA